MNNEENENNDTENTSSSLMDSSSDNKTKEKIPYNWFFPCWLSFLTYGPFVPKENCLSLFEINDAHKDIVKSCVEKRKAEEMQKDLERSSGQDNKRGLSTDQHIQMQFLEQQKKRDDDQLKETLLVGLCIQESALANQIETVERRALRFDNLGKTHQFWDEFELL